MIIYRHIIKEHILPFFYSLLIVIFLFWMQLAVQYLDKIISKGLSFGIIAEIFLLNIAWVIALAIPMSMLVATLMAFGTMSGNNEIIAIKASGHNLPFLITPVFLAACVLMVISIYFNNDILPDANHKAATLISDISRKKPAAMIEQGVLITTFDNYALFVKKVETNSGELTDVKIFSNLPGEDPSTTVADHGTITMTKDEKLLKLTLYNGETHSPSSKNKNEYYVGHFKKQVVFINNIDTELRRTSSSYRGEREMSSAMMMDEINQFKTNKNGYLETYKSIFDSLQINIDSLEKIAVKCTTSKHDSVSVFDTLTSFAAWTKSLSRQQEHAIASVRRNSGDASRLATQIRYEDLKINQYMVEVYKKYSLPVACIVFVLIGAPLGIMARRGSIMVGASYSLAFFILFWASLIWGESMADKLQLSPFIAMWSADIIIGICGIVLIIIMAKETKFISFSFITKLFTGADKKQINQTASSISKNRFSLGKNLIVPLSNLPYKILSKIIGILPAYLAKKFMGWFLGTLSIVIVVFIVVDYISNLSRFEGLPLIIVAKFYWYYLPWLAGLILPIVILLASMSAIGSMVRLNELTAVKAAGISVRKLTFALVILGLALAGLGFYIAEGILPKANTARRQLLEQASNHKAVSEKSSSTAKSEYRHNFYYFKDSRTIYHFEEFRTNPTVGKNVWRQTFSGSSISQRISSESAEYKDNKWVFIKGVSRSFKKDSVIVHAFDTLSDSVLSVSPQDMIAQIKSPEEMSYWELSNLVEKTRKRGEDVSKWRAQLDFKIALPIMNFIVMLLGISISARAGRRGGAVLFGIGLLCIFAYWIISQFAIVFAQNGQLPPLVGAWLGNLVFFIIAIPLYRRASL